MRSARLALGACLSSIFFMTGCLADPPLKLPLQMEPEPLGDGWEIASPEAVGMNPVTLRSAYERLFSEDQFYNSRGLLVVRHGKLVAEGYCRDRAHRDRLQHIKSASKSVTSLVVGIAAMSGALPDLNVAVADVLPEHFVNVDAPDKRAITVRQLLTMGSGLDYDNAEQTTQMMVDEPASSIDFIVQRPLVNKPGTRFHYSDGDVHLAGAVVQRLTGHSLEDYAAQRLFGPLGIVEHKWEIHRDGINYGAFGVYLKPRDMAKLGQMCLQRGNWQGQTVVPSEWIDESTQVYVDRNDGPYGYYWWIRPDFGAYTAAGHGGQYIYVVPAADLVLVHTAEPYTYTPEFGISLMQFEDLVKIILDSIVAP